MANSSPVNLDLFKDPDLRLGLAPYVSNVEDVLNDYLFNDYERRLRSLPVSRYATIEKSYDPALLSYQLYGTTSLWGPLLLYNDMDILDWTEGKTIKAFSIRDYEVMLNDLLIEARKKTNAGG